MTYCEHKVEGIHVIGFHPETEPAIGEWNGRLLVARTGSGNGDNMVGSLNSEPGTIIIVHLHATDPLNHEHVFFSTFRDSP